MHVQHVMAATWHFDTVGRHVHHVAAKSCCLDTSRHQSLLPCNGIAMEALSAPNVQLQATHSTNCKGLARLTALQPVVISTLLVC